MNMNKYLQINFSINSVKILVYIFIFYLDNKAKVYYGLLKEPEIQNIQNTATEEEEEENTGQDPDKPKKKKSKKDPLFSKKTKSDPNAPPIGRMPLPNL